MKQTQDLSIKTIRHLCADMIEHANSGHPGMPLGAAPMMYALWKNHMKVDPNHPTWMNRDRFVLSSGHASSLLYSVLHLTGYDVEMSDLKSFRQLNSLTPGHPEFGHTPGVDATTGPLGQGFAMAVGMAVAEEALRAEYGKEIIDHYTYVICGDGDIQEGITSEASSFAGHQKLSKLIVLYDANEVTLDGDLSASFSEDVEKRYEAYGWDVQVVEDGMNPQAIDKAISKAKSNTEKPSLIIAKTVIGYGVSSKESTHKVHGAPLGEQGIEELKAFNQWSYEPFYVPEKVYEDLDLRLQGETLYETWMKSIDELDISDKKRLFNEMSIEPVSVDFSKSIATRSASQEILNALEKKNKGLILGGSADLSSSNKTYMNDAGDFTDDNRLGRNIFYGIREFAMGSMMNGIILHGGYRSFVSTFLVFSDYVRPAMRLSALMNLPGIYVYSHDSIAVGEDGPTHEPIEHTMSLRLMPNMLVLRPADAKETLAAWNYAMQLEDKPVSLLLSRQNLPVLDLPQEKIDKGFKKGAYLVKEFTDAEGVMIATGSEVSLALEASKKLEEEGTKVNVISMPSMEMFLEQPSSYQEMILPKSMTNRLVLEMGSTLGWDRFTFNSDQIYGIDRFGASAPMDEVLDYFGFSVDKVVSYYKEVCQ